DADRAGPEPGTAHRPVGDLLRRYAAAGPAGPGTGRSAPVAVARRTHHRAGSLGAGRPARRRAAGHRAARLGDGGGLPRSGRGAGPGVADPGGVSRPDRRRRCRRTGSGRPSAPVHPAAGVVEVDMSHTTRRGAAHEITVRGLTKEFGTGPSGRGALLDGGGLPARPGPRTLLVGGPLTGKATLARRRPGRYRPDGGRVGYRLGGEQVDRATAPARTVAWLRG